MHVKPGGRSSLFDNSRLIFSFYFVEILVDSCCGNVLSWCVKDASFSATDDDDHRVRETV